MKVKGEEIKELIIQCSGIWVEALAKDPVAALGDSLDLTTTVLKRTNFPVKCLGVQYYQDFETGTNGSAFGEGEGPLYIDFSESALAKDDKALKDDRKIQLPNKVNNPLVLPVQPYWLTRPPKKGIYQVENPSLTGRPETPPALSARFAFEFGSEDPVRIEYQIPVVHRYVIRTVGQLYRPFVIAPKVTANISDKVYLFGDDEPKEVTLKLRSHSSNPVKGTLGFNLPEGWKVSPATVNLNFTRRGEELPVKVMVTPPSNTSSGSMTAMVEIQGEDEVLSYSQLMVEYEHIPTQTLFPPSQAQMVRINFNKSGRNIGYIMGPTDEVPASLRQVGYNVTMLSDEDITVENLKQFDAVVGGSRLFHVRERMVFLMDQIMQYVEQGGTYVSQYNKAHELRGAELGPYPIKIGRGRVTREEAPVSILEPGHPVLNSPNKITEADFDNWVQERGLYFPTEWDEKYTALTACNDPGEESKSGPLLVADYGKGHYVYTSYSFFRQLPAGVPGAYRLFANLLSYGNE